LERLANRAEERKTKVGENLSEIKKNANTNVPSIKPS
jgi:hypothetical protein